MATNLPPTDDVRAAAMPWIVGVFATWGAGIVSCVLLFIYLLTAQRVEPWIFLTWSTATGLGVRVTTAYIGRKLERIAGERFTFSQTT